MHKEKGKRHFVARVKTGPCSVCGEIATVPSAKKVIICYKHTCHDEAVRRKRARDNKRAKEKRAREKRAQGSNP